MHNYIDFFGDNPFGSQAKMLYHIDKLNKYITTGDTFPIFMEVSLTDACNLNCVWCIAANRQNFTLDTSSVISFLTDFKRLGGLAITFCGGGEPTLHRDFDIITRHAKSIGLDLGLMSNGVFNPKLLPIIDKSFNWVRFSLDTVDTKKYIKWKGHDYVEQVLNNIKSLEQTKVGVNCNISMDMTVQDIIDLIQTTIDNCDYIQFRPVLPRFFKKERIEINFPIWKWLQDCYSNNPKINLSSDKFRELKKIFFKLKDPFPFKNCEGHFFTPILNSDGDIKVCIYHSDNKNLSFGNININSLETIWNSNQRKQAIEYVRNMDYKTNCQICCKLYEINKLINFINNPASDIDKNFI